jgi:hypothetical protein
MSKQVSLTWEEFDEQFKVMPNHLVSTPDQQMFETYGEEVDYVKSIPQNRIWTYTDVGSGTGIYNGWHFVNRLGYFITELPAEEDTDYEVDLQMDTCEQCGNTYDFPCVEDDGELTCPDCCGHEDCQ